MWELWLALGIIVLYLLMGARSYRRRRAESGRAATPFALRELGDAVRIVLAWFLWPFIGFPPDRDAERPTRQA